jgi:hypothetical protein
MSATPPPLAVPIDLAGALLRIDRQAAYRAAKSGALPVLPGFGRRKVPVAALETLVGKSITSADIEAARAWLEPRRNAFARYQQDYREARKALAPAGA